MTKYKRTRTDEGGRTAKVRCIAINPSHVGGALLAGLIKRGVPGLTEIAGDGTAALVAAYENLQFVEYGIWECVLCQTKFDVKQTLVEMQGNVSEKHVCPGAHQSAEVAPLSPAPVSSLN